MSEIKKIKELLDLDEIDVLINEVGIQTLYYLISDTIPQGKSFF